MKIIKIIKNQKGFSLIEVLISIVIITIGLVALSGGLVVGVTLPQRSKQQTLAKQLANSIMETIITAKESGKPGFSSFSDFNSTISPPGPPAVNRFTGVVAAALTAGPDGVYGTCDDGRTGTFDAMAPCPSLGTNLVTLDITPGLDGQFSTTADNKRVPLTSFTRQVVITDVGPATKQIDVTVNYPNATGGRESLTLSTQIANFNVLQ
ncbi:MAG: prepilin-type N-terminal cleavage/methylation domain-containing protein [Acidobacteria bacterium]|nr:prepilin-type N-terminal cleavage/methylation domain-containing protein [Acidobacteriota bacterium]